ncbi:MAG TPA: tetratricopeptide repeat protein, partial [Candidatus Cloacimonadota bacterium]|nr:tetratricopeptide repeat protein [Candidatus Cloacimonadota bacterium]
EFDAALRTYNVDPEQSRDQLRILIVRRLLLENWFSEAGHYLENIATPTDQSRYYDAVLLKSGANLSAADSIFSSLVRSSDTDIALLSYLERLKLVFDHSPDQAISQLEAFLEANQGSEYLGELNYLLGYFYYQKNDYLPAIRHFSRSRNYDMNRYQADRIDAMTAECWFRLQRLDQAEERFNRYLNIYPQGLYRDRAWFNLALVSFQKADYNQARIYFRNLATRHPNSNLMDEARYYMAELDFYQANYNLALQAYRSLLAQHPSDEGLMLRIAQSHFYNQNFTEALAIADSIASPSYDLHLLKANSYFSLRRYPQSLENFQAAYHLTEEALKKKEAQSYVALTLYQMGRFTEASALYLQLSGEEANPDTYLFLAAKSAMQSGSERQAKDLYERFLNLYPSSAHIQEVMADLATMDYNAGRFSESFTGWLNLLRRYNANTGFTISERQILRTTFTGIELCMNRSGSTDMAEALIEEIERYNSDYIKFELQYILVKNYASRSLWQELLREAESIRQAADSSQKSQIELLMAESLINLNQYSAADSLLAGVFSATGSNDALLKRAEINLLEGNTQEALNLYLSSFQSTRNAEVWVKVLECSELLEYQNYPDYLDMGQEFIMNQSQAVLIHQRYLLASSAYDELKHFADQVLDGEYSNYIHARSYLSIAEADFALADYQSSIRTQNRLKFLFPDFVDVQARVAYLNVYSLLRSGAVTEAQMSFWEHRQLFTDEQIDELNSIFEEIR